MSNALIRTLNAQLENPNIIPSKPQNRPKLRRKSQAANANASTESPRKNGPNKLHDTFILHMASLAESASLDGFFTAIRSHGENSPSCNKLQDNALGVKAGGPQGSDSPKRSNLKNSVNSSNQVGLVYKKGASKTEKDANPRKKSTKKEEKKIIVSKNNTQSSGMKPTLIDSSQKAGRKDKTENMKAIMRDYKDLDQLNNIALSPNLDLMDDFINSGMEKPAQVQDSDQCKLKLSLQKALAIDSSPMEEATSSSNDDYIQGLHYHESVKGNYMNKDIEDMLNSFPSGRAEDPDMFLVNPADLMRQDLKWSTKPGSETIPIDDFFSQHSEGIQLEDAKLSFPITEEKTKINTKSNPKKEGDLESEFASRNSLQYSFQMSGVFDFILKRSKEAMKTREKDETPMNKPKRGRPKGSRNIHHGTSKKNMKASDDEESDQGSEWGENEIYRPLRQKGIANKDKIINKAKETRVVDKVKNLNKSIENEKLSSEKKKIFIIIRDNKRQGGTRKTRLQSSKAFSDEIEKDFHNMTSLQARDLENKNTILPEQNDSEDMEEIVKKVKRDSFEEIDLDNVQINVEEMNFEELLSDEEKKCIDKNKNAKNPLKGRLCPLRKTFSSGAVSNKERPRRSTREKREINVDNEKVSDFTFVDFKQHKIQPLKITISLKALIMMNLHAHLSKLEVIGLLGGRVISEEEIVIEEALTCRNILECSNAHSVEMDPASQVETQEELEKLGYKNIGWYHSHPVFKTTPSQIDQETHLNHQICYEDYPYIGMIIAPYFTNKSSLKSKGEIFVFHVVKNQTYKLNFSVKPLPYFTVQDLQSIEKMVSEFHNSKKGIVLDDTWKKDLTYREKILNCLKTLLEENLSLLQDQQQQMANRFSMEVEYSDSLQKAYPDESDALNNRAAGSLESTSVESGCLLGQEGDKIEIQSKQSVERLLDFIKSLLKYEQTQSEISQSKP